MIEGFEKMVLGHVEKYLERRSRWGDDIVLQCQSVPKSCIHQGQIICDLVGVSSASMTVDECVAVV